MKKIVLGLFLCSMVFSVAAPAKMVQVKGSDTCVNVVARLAEEYIKETPGQKIAVTGGGSGVGIAALINGQADIAMASRSIKTKEIFSANKKGIDPFQTAFAVDGLCVIVNRSNPVSALSVEKIGKIFKAGIKNWNAVDGEDKEISLYGRQSSSGTFAFFQKYVLKGDYSPKMMRMNGNAQIVEAVKVDKGGIGYVGVGYVVDPKTGKVVDGISVLNVSKKAGEKAYSPLDKKAVSSGDYPIWRYLYQYTNGAPKKGAAKFIAWELSPAGQAVVESQGFYPIARAFAKKQIKKW